MKTGMEFPLIGLVALVALAILWNIYSGMQLDVAVAATNAAVAGTAVPAPMMIGGQWVVNAIVGTLIGSAATAFFAGVWVWVRRQIRMQNTTQKHWSPGPNAQWGQQRGPKVMSEAELYRLMLMRQMAGGFVDTGAKNAPRVEADDEASILF